MTSVKVDIVEYGSVWRENRKEAIRNGGGRRLGCAVLSGRRRFDMKWVVGSILSFMFIGSCICS